MGSCHAVQLISVLALCPGKKIAIYPLPATTTGPAVAAYQALPDMLR